MIPSEYVITLDFPIRLNRESELITVSCIPKKQQACKWHVEIVKVVVLSKFLIVGNDSLNWPNKAKTVLALNPIAFEEKLT